MTLKQLDKHYPGIFDDIVFVHFYTDKHIPKSEVCRKLGVHYLIEDSLENAMDVAEVGIPVFVLEKPRNSRRDETHENIYKIQNWKDIILHESL